MIPDTVVDEVRARADIVEIVGEHVALKRAGREFRGLCPFHQEKTPSFYVVPAKGFYKCFGCGDAGDVFAFLMKRQGLAFNEVVKQLAARLGIEVPETSGARVEEPHKKLHEALAFAADYYERMLRGEQGERARRYLDGRGIKAVVWDRFRLGYALDDWRALRSAATKHGIDDEILLEAGLIKTSERSDEPYDRLRDRIIFPIADASGRIVGFGGRVLGKAAEGAPKYLNSPETPVYHKGKMLYGLNWSKGAIRREGEALLVEGYMDYVSLAAHGVENVVAGLGTALTPEQAELISRYTTRALLLYDSDAAGQRATFRTGDALLRARVHPLVVQLPAGEDPDSVVRKGGSAALRPHLVAATDVLERKLQILDERGYFRDIDGRREALDHLLSTIRAAADPALRDIYVSSAAARTGVERSTLQRSLGLPSYRPEPAPAAPRPQGRAELRERQWSSEKQLLKLMLRDESRVPQAARTLEPTDFRDPVHQQIYEHLLGTIEGLDSADVQLSAAAAARMKELQSDPEEISDGDRNFDDAVAYMRANTIQLRLFDLQREIKTASPEEQGELLLEKQELNRQLRELAAFSRLGSKLSLRWTSMINKRN